MITERTRTLEGKVALVAGAAHGIGRDIAIALSEQGAHVAIADGEAADELKAEIGADRAFAAVCDRGSPQHVNDFVAEAVRRYGTIDILVNSPTRVAHAPLVEIDDGSIESAFSQGPTAALYFMRACYPYLVGGGRVINVPSGSQPRGGSSFCTHIAARAGIGGITWAAAREWGRHGITVNVVCPVAGSTAHDDGVQHPRLLENILNRVCIPGGENIARDVGGAVTFLAGPHARDITGCVLMVPCSNIFRSKPGT